MSRIDYYLSQDDHVPGQSTRNRTLSHNSFYSLPLRNPVGVDALSPESDAVVSKKDFKSPVAPIGTSPEIERGFYDQSLLDFPLSSSYTSSDISPRHNQWSINHHDYATSMPNLPDFHAMDSSYNKKKNGNLKPNENQNSYQNYYHGYHEMSYDPHDPGQHRRRTISWDTGNEDSSSAIPPRIFDLFSPSQPSDQYSYLVQAISSKNPPDTNNNYLGSMDDSDSSLINDFENMSMDEHWQMSPPVPRFNKIPQHSHQDHMSSSHSKKEPPFSPPFPSSSPTPSPSSSFTTSPSLSSSFSSSPGSSSPTMRDKVSSSYGEHPHGEHPSRTLFVRNISSNVDDEELRSLFEAYGPLRGMYTQCKHRGFVMISYYDIRHAKNAMRHLQNKVLRRRKLDIHYSIPKDNPSEKDQNQGTLVVFNLDPSVTNDELKEIFGNYGEIKEIRETPNKKHHKFIEFYDVRDAEEAMKHLNKTEIRSKKIKIEPSRPGGIRKNLAHSLATEVIEDSPSPTPLSPHRHPAPSTSPNTSSFHEFMSLSSSAPPEHHMKNHMGMGVGMGGPVGSQNVNIPGQGVLMSPEIHSKEFSHPSSFQYSNPYPSTSPYHIGTNVTWGVSAKQPEDYRSFSLSYTEVNTKISKYDVNPVGSGMTGIRARSRSDSGEDQSQYILEIDRVLGGVDKRTTLMIKNIPNKYTQKMLLSTMDERFKGQYDFFYLPIDFKNKCNVGYAFINFIKYDSIAQFYTEYNGKKWEKFNSDKVCVITYARIQGKGALIAHFQNSSLMCEDKKCRPIIFHSDGPSLGEQEPFPVGPNLRTRRVSGGGKEELGRNVGFSSPTIPSSSSGTPPPHHLHNFPSFPKPPSSPSAFAPNMIYGSYGSFRDDSIDDLTISF